MRNKWRWALTGLLLGYAAYGVGAEADARDKIMDLAKGSTCASKQWPRRVVAPVSYIQGIALTYAKVYQELELGIVGSSSIIASKEVIPNSRVDALAIYKLGNTDKVARLRSVYTLAIGHGLQESHGNPTVGADCVESKSSKYRNCADYELHPEQAEAGLYQPSFNSLHSIDDVLPALMRVYERTSKDCLAGIFQAGLPDKRERAFGNGAVFQFQTFTKACPAFATEYESVMLRVNARHFGPIQRKEVPYVPECESMLRNVERLVDDATPDAASH